MAVTKQIDQACPTKNVTEVIHNLSCESDTVNVKPDMLNSNTPLSKRAKKRLLRHEKWIEYRPIKRAKEREKLKLKRQEAKLNNMKLGPSRKQLKNSKMSTSECKLRVVLDFSFDHLMSSKDLNKCVNQMSRCYSVNRRSKKPLQLHVTSFVGPSKQIIEKHNGYSNWDVNFFSKSYLEVFKKEELIYLTSDSENVIESLDDDKVYIIGALVDHNSHKGICLKTAMENGIAHGRLPIDQFVQMKSRQVLTVDHVFAILVHVASSDMSWQQAFLNVIPQRKQVIPKFESSDNNNQQC